MQQQQQQQQQPQMQEVQNPDQQADPSVPFDPSAQQQQQQQQPLQPQPQRPVIPVMQLAPAQELQQQQMLTQNSQRVTPRNPDGSVNFDAHHRSAAILTPRTKAERRAYLARAAGVGGPGVHHAPTASLLGSEHNTDVGQLDEGEISELRDMFTRYDVNGDAHLALDEMASFLRELEFSYSETFVDSSSTMCADCTSMSELACVRHWAPPA